MTLLYVSLPSPTQSTSVFAKPTDLGQHVTVLMVADSPELAEPAVAQARVYPVGQASPSVRYGALMVKDGGKQAPDGVFPVKTGVGVPYMLLTYTPSVSE